MLQKWISCLLAGVLLLFCLAGCQGGLPAEPVSSPASSEPVPEISAQPQATEAPTASPKPSAAPAAGGVPSPSPAPTASPTPTPEPTPEPPKTLAVQVKVASPIYKKPAPGETAGELAVGKELTVTGTDDPLWYAALLEDGTVGYLYGEAVFRSENGKIAETSVFGEYLADTLARLQSQLPQDMYWNHVGGEENPWMVTNTPCDHDRDWDEFCNCYSGATLGLFPDYDTLRQCTGFASFLSDQIFGVNAPLFEFKDPRLLRVGDHIRLTEWEHSATVKSIGEEGIVVGEANYDYIHCQIDWSRPMTWADLYDLEWDSTYITRYPLCPDGKGGYTPW